MPMDFPDMRSLERAAEVHKFRDPLPEESETNFRQALHEHVLPIDRVESFEILFGIGCNKWTERQRMQSMFSVPPVREKQNPQLPDDYAIGEQLINRANQYFISARNTGRTYRMIESAKDGDLVIFTNDREKERVRKIFLQQGKNIKCVVVDPKRPCEVYQITRGNRCNVLFDHTWVEQFYLSAIERAARDIVAMQTDMTKWSASDDREIYKDPRIL